MATFDPLAAISQAIESVGSSVGSEIQFVLDKLSSGFNTFVLRPASTDISNAINEVGKSVDQLGTAASTGIANSLNAVANTLGTVESSVVGGFERGLSAVSSSVQSIGSSITSTLASVTQSVEGGFRAIEQGVAAGFTNLVTGIEQGFTIVGNQIVQGIAEIVRPIETFIAGLPADIQQIAEAAGKAIENVVATTERIASGVEDYVKRTDLVHRLEKFALLPDEVLMASVVGSTKDALQGIFRDVGFEPDEHSLPAIARISAAAGSEVVIGVLEEAFPSMAYTLQGLIGQITEVVLGPDYKALEHAANAGFPVNIPGVSDAITARFREIIDDKTFYEYARKNGFSGAIADEMTAGAYTLLSITDLVASYRRGTIEDIDTLYKFAKWIGVQPDTVDKYVALFDQLLPVSESITMWRRDITPEGQSDPFDDQIKAGYTLERITAMKDASYVLPGIFQFQDMIRRRVDNEANVEKFQLDYELNEDYFKIAKANGYDRETALRLYRMYWEVPPIFIVENQFKSGKMPEADFRDIMSLLGYTPYWIDRFVQNLKPAITEAEIKDLYKYQEITADEIITELMGIGVPLDLAKKKQALWVSTIKNASPIEHTAGQATAASIKGDTKALIVEAYKDGVITSVDALHELNNIGITGSTALLTIHIAEYQNTQSKIKEAFADASAGLSTGVMSLTDAINEVQQAGASAVQLDMYTKRLQKVASKKGSMPTKAEFEKWYQKGIITEDQLAEALSLLGYADGWLPFFMIEAGVPAKDVETMFAGVQLAL